MNLPDFSKHVELNQLRQNMGTELISWNSGEDWKSINIDEILVTTGIDIPSDEIEPADDGTLEYEGRKVVVYIRDQYAPSDATREQLCKFHVADCVTLQEMRRSNRYERYVVTNRTDGKFIVNFLAESWYRDKEEEVERRLYVCKNCLRRLNYNGYKSYYGNQKKNEIRESFDLRAFFEKYDSQITREPTHTDITAPSNEYPQDWNQISRRYKEKRNWKCEECGVDLRDERKFLHVHHKNGLKFDNEDENLLALCIGCHAKMPQHQHMKSLPDYKEYRRRFVEKEFDFPFQTGTVQRKYEDRSKYDMKGKVWWQPKGWDDDVLKVLVPEGRQIKNKETYLGYLQDKLDVLIAEVADDPIGMTGQKTAKAAVWLIVNKTLELEAYMSWLELTDDPTTWARTIIEGLEVSEGWTRIQMAIGHGATFEKAQHVDQETINDQILEEVLYGLMEIV